MIYLRWRDIYGTPHWLVDRHWYEMLAKIHASKTANEIIEAFRSD